MSLSFTIDDLVNEAKRELNVRRSVYPRWVAAGRLSQSQSDRRIELQWGTIALLEKLRDLARIVGASTLAALLKID